MAAEIVSLGRKRADKTGEAASWSPREACIEMLRMIDAGLAINDLIICYDGQSGAGFQNATQSSVCAVGLLQTTQFEMLSAGRA